MLRQIQTEFPLLTSPLRTTGDRFPDTKLPLLLIIDDDIEFITFMKDFLEQHGYQVLASLTGKKGLELFYDFHPDLVLIDYILPDTDGVALLTQIVEKARNEFTPVIMVSAHNSNEHRALSFNLGATDFIGKPVRTDVLLPFLKNRLASREQILAHILQDELTGAFNRKFLEKKLKEQSALFHKENGYTFSAAMVDLDHFKKVNDTYGHHTGDQVLETFVKVFEQMKTSGETISRYGGEEFVVIFPGASAQEADARVEEWRNRFSSITFTSGDEQFHVHFSAGIAQFSDAPGGESILERADKALYYAKRTGRNRTVSHTHMPVSAFDAETITLLIVENDPSVRQLLEDFFSTRSFISDKPVRVITFHTRQQFLEEDWYHPEEDYVLLLASSIGIDTLPFLKTKYDFRNVAVMIMTGEEETERVEEALREEAEDYLLKPFRLEDLGEWLDGVADRMFI
ncbi:response regulator [Salimicrobium album]|uniref:Diguanylate cyclase (GGDEF) domain-containing protein n=1 Tax=Salimicrobium album TaxID=50717 RepID=A0A1H3HWR7_9BACI|nr:response regulator [Salimicrobium album]SDY19194.1 diguanylate cyclase (GGDEF) domain-containing protein [Salimicrobium album]